MAVIPSGVRRIVAALRSQKADPQRRGLLNWFRHTSANVHVTNENSEQVAAIWACMDVIASALASSDWNVYSGYRGADKKTALPRDNLQYVLNTRFNPDMTAQSGKRAMMLAAASWGNGYAEIERDMANRIIGLWPISPDRVEPRRMPDTGEFFYRVYNDQGTQQGMPAYVDMDPENVFHVRGPSMNGFAGDNMIAKAVQCVGMALALDKFTGAYFGNGATLGGILRSKTTLSPESFERLRSQFNQRHQGSERAFKVGIVEGDVEYTPIQVDAEKAQLEGLKNTSVEDICRFFHVPPHKIQHLLRSTNNNIEHQGLEFSRDTLRPWKVEIEQESDFKLIPARGPRKFIELDLDWAEQGDYKSRAEAFQTLRNTGVFSANDILRKLGENTIGKDGDIRIVQGANIRLGDVGAAYKQGGQNPPAPSPAPAAPPANAGSDSTRDALLGWIASIFEAAQRVQDNRVKHLAARGKPDPAETSREMTVKWLEERIDEPIKHLSEWAGQDRWPDVPAALERVADGQDPFDVADALIGQATEHTEIN